MTSSSGGKQMHVMKAPPSPSAVASVILIASVALYLFPSIEEIDHIASAEAFSKRIFPEYVSLDYLVFVRSIFAFFCLFITATKIFGPGNSLTPTYYPNSKLRKNVTFELRGVKNLFPFTMWCWNLLGLSFSFSAYVGWRTGRGEQVSPWVLRAALLLWEMAAPFTLVVGAIVKYVLWPTAFKHNGTVGTTNFRTWIAMCQHNVNVVMALSEVALLGGLPVKMSHISLSVLFGVAYVVFTWSIVNLWNPQTGPAFIYIFMDTTLGAFATIALYALVGALMVFYGIFSGVEWLLELSASGLLGHIAFVVLLCMLVCKVRD